MNHKRSMQGQSAEATNRWVRFRRTEIRMITKIFKIDVFS